MIDDKEPEKKEPEEQQAIAISRRTVLATAALIPVTALTAAAQVARATALTAAERRTLEALVDRLAPADELGPGALEMGAANYIDLSLADFLAAEKGSIAEGLAAMDAFARTTQGAEFAELPAEKKDAVLRAMENGTASGFAGDSRVFFNRIHRLTLEGMFGDPYYGGNRNFAGWDLIRYPGPRLAVSAEEQRMSALPKPLHQSAYGAERGGHGH
jgi:hypothetical protein